MFNMMSADDTGWMVAGIVAAIFLGLVIAWQFFDRAYPDLFATATNLFYFGYRLS